MQTVTIATSRLSKPAPVEVLLPGDVERDERCRVLYVLPVETGAPARREYGDALAVIRDLGLHNRLRLICVAPSFDTVPWYGNHASDPHLRHEDYLTQDVVPMIDRLFPTTGRAAERLLLGFSKSGWGAMNLIFRHPDLFGYAASWDAPLMLGPEMFGAWGTAAHFGTRENFAAHLPAQSAREHAAPFRERCRLVHAGKAYFGTRGDGAHPYTGPSHLEAFHDLLDALGIRHTYLPDVKAAHSWNAVWVEPVVLALAELNPFAEADDNTGRTRAHE